MKGKSPNNLSLIDSAQVNKLVEVTANKQESASLRLPERRVSLQMGFVCEALPE